MEDPQVKAIRNLNRRSVGPYRIHVRKTVLSVKGEKAVFLVLMQLDP